jgi:hypothetical protein
MRRSLPVISLVASLALVAAMFAVANLLRLGRADDRTFALVYLAVATVWIFLVARQGRRRPDVGALRWAVVALAQAPALWATFLFGGRIAAHGLRELAPLAYLVKSAESFVGAAMALFLLMWTWRLLDHDARRARGEVQ